MKKLLVISVLLLHAVAGKTQPAALPVEEMKGDESKPYVIYISGDGGKNNFSTVLCNNIHNAGYSVAFLNAKSYFWEKKSPEEAAAAFSAFLDSRMRGRKNQQIQFIGYSFGADVMPFIVNRLPATNKAAIAGIFLLAPSPTTDFEIHLTDMLGINKSRGMNVVAEINKLGNLRTVMIQSANDPGIRPQDITLKNFKAETFEGGHHFDGNASDLAYFMLNLF